jgi:hypothetical protein
LNSLWKSVSVLYVCIIIIGVVSVYMQYKCVYFCVCVELSMEECIVCIVCGLCVGLEGLIGGFRTNSIDGFYIVGLIVGFIDSCHI